MSNHDGSDRQENILRNAVGLAFYSLLIFLQGNSRAAQVITPISQSLSLSFPAEALLAGGLAGMVMGFTGFALAGALMAGVKVHRLVLIVQLAVQTLFGWFVFILFVFVNPAYEAANTPGNPDPWTWRQYYNSFVASGILASAGYCATMLGAQFAFTYSLFDLVQGKSHDAKYYRSRGIVYSTLVFLTGVWILVGGACTSTLNPGPLNVVAPPLFVIYSGIPIATGCLAIVTGLVGVVFGVLPPRSFNVIIIGFFHILNCLWQLAVMDLYQPPVMGFPSASSQIATLILSQLVAAYFHAMRAKLDGVLDVRLEPVELAEKDN